MRDADIDCLLDLFLRLVEIPSPSGRERRIADFILTWLCERGLDPIEDDTATVTGADCGNLIVKLPGRGRGTPIVVSAHMDTVAVDGEVRALVESGIVRSAGDTILGADDKAACAILMLLLAELADDPPGCAVEAIFSTSEEVGLRGAKAVDLTSLGARAGFVFDSAGPIGHVITRAPGQKTITATFHGVAAHAGIAPERGRNAIVAAARAIAAMELGRLDEETTANVGVIDGGVAINVVPETCVVRGEARSHDPARLAAQAAAMLAAIQLGAGVEGIDVETIVSDEFGAFSLDGRALPVRIASAALREVGLEPVLAAGGGGSDVNVYNQRGLPSVNLNVGMEDVHSPDEWIPVERLRQAHELLRAIVRVAAATGPD